MYMEYGFEPSGRLRRFGGVGTIFFTLGLGVSAENLTAGIFTQ